MQMLAVANASSGGNSLGVLIRKEDWGNKKME